MPKTSRIEEIFNNLMRSAIEKWGKIEAEKIQQVLEMTTEAIYKVEEFPLDPDFETACVTTLLSKLFLIRSRQTWEE